MSVDDSEQEDDWESRSKSIMLNCGATPKLSDLELNVISDEINYICDELLFVEVMKDTNRGYRQILDNDIGYIIAYRAARNKPHPHFKFKSNMQKSRFRAIGVKDASDLEMLNEVCNKMDEFLFPNDPRPVVWNNVAELEESLDRLGESLDGMNGKKESLGMASKWGKSMVVMYAVYIAVMAFFYVQTLIDEEKGAIEAELYNIGFISQVTYAVLIFRLMGDYNTYCKIKYTDGDLDSGVCSALAGIITNTRLFYEKLLCYKKSQNDANCKKEILDAMYKIYEDKYVNNVFIAAKSEYKAAVNSINKFIEKQTKFMLREANFDVNYTADNDALEYVYRVFLYNRGMKLFKDGRSAKERRKAVQKKNYKYDTPASSGTYDKFLTDELFKSFLKVLPDPNKSMDNDAMKKGLRNMIEIMNEVKTEYLPEYLEIVDLIFSIDTVPYFNSSNTKYVEDAFMNLDNLEYGDKHVEYFLEVKDKLKMNGVLSYKGDFIDVEVTLTTFLTKIQSRKKNVLTLEKRYEDFQARIRSSLLTNEDISEGGYFHDVFRIVKEDFNEVTSEYKLTLTIVMGFMTSYIESDEEFESDATYRGTALSNIRFLVEAMLNQLKVSRDIKENVLNDVDPNMSKYISFLKFENKLNQLDDHDLGRLFLYVRNINTTMRNFRKYVKSEEISYSKKFQIAETYERAVTNLKWASLVIILIAFYDLIDKKDNYETLNAMAKSTKQGMGKGLSGLSEGASKLGSQGMKGINGMKGMKGMKGINGIGSSKGTSSPGSSSVTGSFVTAPNQFGRGGDGQKEQKEQNEQNETDKSALKSVEPEPLSKQLTTLVIPMVGVITTWNVLFEFAYSYLTKYKTDINYDKVTTVTNTEIFERELEKLERYFFDFKETKRNTKACKLLYTQLLKTIESYEQCNLVKGSVKSTPFPAVEMMTNGLILVLCIAIVYAAYTGTGISGRQNNTKKLNELLKLEESMNEMGDKDVEKITRDEIKEEIESKTSKQYNDIYRSWRRAYPDNNRKGWDVDKEDKFTKKLKEFLKEDDRFDFLKKKMSDDKGIFKEKDSTDKLKGVTGPEQFVEIARGMVDRKYIFHNAFRIFDTWNVEGEGSTGGQLGGANSAASGVGLAPMGVGMGNMGMGMGNMGMGMQVGMPMAPIDLTVEKALLEKYSKQNDRIKAQLILMKRDTGYVNWILAGSLFTFGTYFVDRLKMNTNNYKELMSSGGTYTRECL